MVRWPTAPLVLLTASMAAAIAQTPDEETAWLRSWIPVRCCVTNNCCFAIQAADVEPLASDRWRIRATGQVLARTEWSPDGRWWRCACDWIEGKWVVYEQAHTRCIFPPLQSVMLGERGAASAR